MPDVGIPSAVPAPSGQPSFGRLPSPESLESGQMSHARCMQLHAEESITVKTMVNALVIDALPDSFHIVDGQNHALACD